MALFRLPFSKPTQKGGSPKQGHNQACASCPASFLWVEQIKSQCLMPPCLRHSLLGQHASPTVGMSLTRGRRKRQKKHQERSEAELFDANYAAISSLFGLVFLSVRVGRGRRRDAGGDSSGVPCFQCIRIQSVHPKLGKTFGTKPMLDNSHLFRIVVIEQLVWSEAMPKTMMAQLNHIRRGDARSMRNRMSFKARPVEELSDPL